MQLNRIAQLFWVILLFVFDIYLFIYIYIVCVCVDKTNFIYNMYKF